MKDVLVVGKLKDGMFEKFMGFMQSEEGMAERKKFEYSMKEKSMASVKVLKAYALEVGIPEKEWDEGVNKAVDKFYGSKFDEAKTNACHKFVNSTVPNGEDRVKKVVQTLY